MFRTSVSVGERFGQFKVGLKVGCVDGNDDEEGTAVEGSALGIEVGVLVGTRDGDEEGEGVGKNEGGEDGERDGL
jgi:hypothetical protein